MKRKHGRNRIHPPSQYQRHGLPRHQTCCEICGWSSTDPLKLELHLLECEQAAHKDRADHLARQAYYATRRKELQCTACGAVHVFSSQQEQCDIEQWEQSAEYAEMRAETLAQQREDGRL